VERRYSCSSSEDEPEKPPPGKKQKARSTQKKKKKQTTGFSLSLSVVFTNVLGVGRDNDERIDALLLNQKQGSVNRIRLDKVGGGVVRRRSARKLVVVGEHDSAGVSSSVQFNHIATLGGVPINSTEKTKKHQTSNSLSSCQEGTGLSQHLVAHLLLSL